MNSRHLVIALTTAGGALLAALAFSTATASADVWTISDAAGQPPPEVVSVSGMPPFDQSILEQGGFIITHDLPNGQESFFATGVLSETQSFGLSNEEYVSNSSALGSSFPDHSVVDIMSVGGYENIYVDLPGDGAGGANAITDTLVTPFRNFDIPVTFDAVALDATAPAASVNLADLLEPGGLAAALDADWAAFVALF